MSSRRSLALVGASAMLLSILPAAAFAQAPAEKVLDQLQLSNDKVKDAAEISALWAQKVGKADEVLVTTDAVFADSLASGALQGRLNAPLLFVDAKVGLDATTTNTITSLGASKVTVLGGVQAIGADLVAALQKVPGVKDVTRLSGESRVETSVMLAKATKAKDDTVIIARADDYADSLAAGALAARNGYPVLLSPNPYKGADGKMVDLHPSVATYLKEAGIKKVLVAGGSQVVADSTVAAVKNIVNDTTRVAGATRRETAVELAKLWKSVGKVTVIDGYSADNGFHNGFAAALSAAKLGAPVIISNKGEQLSPAEEALIGPAATGVTGYCGTYVNSTICGAVAAKQQAKVVVSKLIAQDPALELKVAPAETMRLMADGKQSKSREYTVQDVKVGTEYTIMLAKGKQDEKGNMVLDLGTDGNPQPAPAGVGLTVVNGSTVDKAASLKVQAIAPTMTFSVTAHDANAFGDVVPVVLRDNAGKTVVAGQGGAIQVLPELLADGKYLDDISKNGNAWIVQFVDKANNLAVIENGEAKVKRTLTFKPSDTLYRDGISPVGLVDFDTFKRQLSVGDTIVSERDGNNPLASHSRSLFYRSPSIPSTIVWSNADPFAPIVKLNEPAEGRTDTTIPLTFGGVKPGQTIVLKIAKLSDEHGIRFRDDESKFTITREIPVGKINAQNAFMYTVTGLDPDSRYDFAAAVRQDGELSSYNDFGLTYNAANPHPDASMADKAWVKTMATPVALGIAKVERVDDVVNDGVNTINDPGTPPSGAPGGAPGQGQGGSGGGAGGQGAPVPPPAAPPATPPGTPGQDGGTGMTPPAPAPGPGAPVPGAPDAGAGAGGGSGDPGQGSGPGATGTGSIRPAQNGQQSPTAYSGSRLLEVTLNTDKFDGGTIDPTKIKVIANQKDVVPVVAASAVVDGLALRQDQRAGGKVGNGDAGQGDSKIFYIQLSTALQDSKVDLEYTVVLESGAVHTHEKPAPNTRATYSFKY